jgi:hypothetical protein
MSYYKTNMCLYAEEKLIEREDTKNNVEYFGLTHYHHCCFAST